MIGKVRVKMLKLKKLVVHTFIIIGGPIGCLRLFRAHLSFTRDGVRV